MYVKNAASSILSFKLNLKVEASQGQRDAAFYLLKDDVTGSGAERLLSQHYLTSAILDVTSL